MMFKKKNNFKHKNDLVTIVAEDQLSTYPVIDVVGDSIEYDDGVLNLSDAKKFYDVSSGGLHFVFNLDLPAKVEANNLKMLRRSQALNNIFKYDRGKKFDLMTFMPYIVIILLVLFK